MVFAVIGLQLCNQKLLIQWQQYKTSSPCQRVDFFLSCRASINIFGDASEQLIIVLGDKLTNNFVV